MSKLNLKDNIWIEGFTREELFDLSKEDWRNIVDDVSVDKMLYQGKTSVITEELASKILINHWNFRHEYPDFYNKGFDLNSSKESIQSACNKEFCIIHKTN